MKKFKDDPQFLMSFILLQAEDEAEKPFFKIFTTHTIKIYDFEFLL
jgi:hypothetical protein